MNRKILVTAALFGILAVILGAFAAHGLENLVTTEELDSFQTGVRYQMYHALLLLFIGTTNHLNKKSKRLVYYFVVFGLILFSGSIYGLSTNSLTGINFLRIAFITPIGGFLLIVSWLILLINFVKLKHD